MHCTRTAITVLGGTLAAIGCARHRVEMICPDDGALRSAIASQFSSDTNTIAGQVVSIMLEPLAGSQVALSPPARQVETGADGRFQFASVAPGDYVLEVRRTGYGPVREPIRVRPKAGVRVTVTLGASVVCLTAVPRMSPRSARRASPPLLANGR